MNVMRDLVLLRYAVTELGIWVWVTWVILAVITYGLLRAVRLQNKHYRLVLSHGEDSKPDEEKIALFQLAKLRGDTVCFLWIIVAGLVIVGDIARAVNVARNYGAATAQANADKPTDNPYAALEVPAQSNEDDAATMQTAVVEQSTSDDARSIEKIKSSYEDALVSYLILRRCHMAEKTQYSQLYAALLRALHFTNDRNTIAKGVLSAATGSYQSLYADLDCSSEMMHNTNTHFALFLKQVALV